jgi:hypothetical protein
MGYKQKGFPNHYTGPQSKNPSPIKMSGQNEAVLMGAGAGAAQGAMAGAMLGPVGAAVGGVIGGVVGGIGGSKKYEANQDAVKEQKRIDDEIANQGKIAEERDLASRVASDNAKSYGGKLPGRVERINTDGTVTNSTEVAGTPADLGKLYSPINNTISKKGIIKTKKEGEAITQFNNTSMNIANEPTGTDVAIRKSKK